MWKAKHKQIIDSFLEYLNLSSDDFVLKGDIALLNGYGLDRFSENIDLDAPQSSRIRGIVDSFCAIYDYKYKEEKNTPTTEIYTIHYSSTCKPLKIDVLHRGKRIDKSLYTNINGVLIYKINPLCQMKTIAFAVSEKIQDLYDIAFICNLYFKSLLPETILQLQNVLEHKGPDHFDYMMYSQNDDLINLNELEDKVLIMYDKLGLLSDDGT